MKLLVSSRPPKLLQKLALKFGKFLSYFDVVKVLKVSKTLPFT